MWNKKRKSSLKSKDQKILKKFDLREKNIDFFRDYSFLLSEAKYKAKYGTGLKILTSR